MRLVNLLKRDESDASMKDDQDVHVSVEGEDADDDLVIEEL